MQEQNLYQTRMVSLEEGDVPEPRTLYFTDEGAGRFRLSVFINGREISRQGYEGMSEQEAKEKIQWLNDTMARGWFQESEDKPYKCLYCGAEGEGVVVQNLCLCRLPT